MIIFNKDLVSVDHSPKVTKIYNGNQQTVDVTFIYRRTDTESMDDMSSAQEIQLASGEGREILHSISPDDIYVSFKRTYSLL